MLFQSLLLVEFKGPIMLMAIGIFLMVIGGLWCAANYVQHAGFPDDGESMTDGPDSGAYFLSSLVGMALLAVGFIMTFGFNVALELLK